MLGVGEAAAAWLGTVGVAPRPGSLAAGCSAFAEGGVGGSALEGTAFSEGGVGGARTGTTFAEGEADRDEVDDATSALPESLAFRRFQAPKVAKPTSITVAAANQDVRIRKERVDVESSGTLLDTVLKGIVRLAPVGDEAGSNTPGGGGPPGAVMANGDASGRGPADVVSGKEGKGARPEERAGGGGPLAKGGADVAADASGGAGGPGQAPDAPRAAGAFEG